MLETLDKLLPSDFPSIQRQRLTTLQVNLGYLCNQQCLHCHVAAGPKRKEMMQEQTIESVLTVLQQLDLQTLDLTGGAPELNPAFRYLVTEARALGCRVIDRCNLTVLFEPGQTDTAEFLAEQQVEIVASLPCYLEQNVNQQRGQGVYQLSIKALQQLNQLGYGAEDSGLFINLVFNPQGPVLPPDQQSLEADYRCQLDQRFGIRFNHLLALANLPIQRFGSSLISKGQFDDYVDLLKQSHQQQNLDNVMCRSLVSVDWQGYLFDCDFNQMLNLPLGAGQGKRLHLNDLLEQNINQASIVVADHCYGCTAGQGSSCGGALN